MRGKKGWKRRVLLEIERHAFHLSLILSDLSAYLPTSLCLSISISLVLVSLSIYMSLSLSSFSLCMGDMDREEGRKSEQAVQERKEVRDTNESAE